MAYTPAQQKQYDQLISAGASKSAAANAASLVAPSKSMSVEEYQAATGTGPRPGMSVEQYQQATAGRQVPLSGTTAAVPGTGKASGLLNFANSLSEVVNMAKQKRNASMMSFMAPGQGTVMASDFNSVLSNMNQASDTRSSGLIDSAMEYAQPAEAVEPTILGSASTGYFTYDPATQTATPVQGYNPASSGSGSTGSSMGSKQVTSLKNALNASKFEGTEADGKYSDPNLYLLNYQSWINSGGSSEEFFRQFPPSTYINPENTWLPPEIMKFAKKESGGSYDDL